MRKIYSVIFTISILWLSSCDDFLDVNRDPGRLVEEEATLPTLLPTAIRYSGSAVFGAAQYGVQYPQYLVGQGVAAYQPYGFDGFWLAFYSDALPTLQEIIKRGDAAGAGNYTGIARTLLALNLMTAADTYGDAPYSEANQGPAHLYPCYDKMQDLYQVHIIGLLNQALADFEKPKSEIAALQTVQNDFIYNGDINLWKKATRALLARYYLHLSSLDDDKAPADKVLDDAAAQAALAFASNAEDLQLVYENVVLNQNPWFPFLGNPAGKPMQPSSYIVDILTGRNIFNGVTDPRLAIYMTKTGTAPANGLVAGNIVNTANTAVNVNMTATNWHMRAVAPLLFVTYAEMQFIIAEALYNTDRPASYAAYIKGIEASLLKVGVPAAAVTTFKADPQIAVGEAGLTMSHIMLQKYAALYLQFESWTDMRRHQYDPTVYTGLTKPVNNQMPSGAWIQRSKLADEEPGVNTCIPEAKPQDVPLWLFE